MSVIKKIESILEENDFELIEDNLNSLNYGMREWQKYLGDELITVSIGYYKDERLRTIE